MVNQTSIGLAAVTFSPIHPSYGSDTRHDHYAKVGLFFNTCEVCFGPSFEVE